VPTAAVCWLKLAVTMSLSSIASVVSVVVIRVAV
jgi:hypothetical protein